MGKTRDLFKKIKDTKAIFHAKMGTIKRTPQTARIQKGHPKHSNINKMKRQRNTQQVKEQRNRGKQQNGKD